MDVFSHFALPYLAALLLTRRHRVALAAGVGGFAPDLDAATYVLALWDPLYALGHRGFSHSLLGAPLYALGAVLVLRAPFWRRIIPIAEEVRFGPRLALVAVLASYTHIALDALTMWGVPALYPWSSERYTTRWFFYSVTLMIPISGYLVWRVARGTQTPRLLRQLGALLVGALVLSGGVRAATHPDDGAEITIPASGEWSWTSLTRNGTGWDATFWSWGRAFGAASYPGAPPEGPDAEEAFARARADVEARAFHLYAGGPVVTRTEPADEPGAWNVTFLDLMVRTQVDRSPWFPFRDEPGLLRLRIDAEGVSVVED